MIMCEWDAPEEHSGQCCVHLYAFVSYRSVSPQFQFSLYAFTLDLYIVGKILLTSVVDPRHFGADRDPTLLRMQKKLLSFFLFLYLAHTHIIFSLRN